MSDFTPTNHIEILLRKVITDRNTPLWEFYTPLAAATLWLIVENNPAILSKGRTTNGQNPGLLSFTAEERSFIGIYTSAARAQAAMARYKISPRKFTIISLQGYDLLSLVQATDHDLCMNLGNEGCQRVLDNDLVEILLSRPRPAAQDVHHVAVDLEIDPSRHLGPVRDFLRKQPHVRAAWIFGDTSSQADPARTSAYEFHLLMDDPEDDSLLQQVETMLKALTPISQEWTTGVLAGDDQSFRNLAAKLPPFYRRDDFLKDA